MKKNLIIIVLLILAVTGIKAQNRKYVGNFSNIQQYYNPGLTSFEGSMVKTYYRDQWAGFEDAPRTFYVSGELSLSQLKAKNKSESAPTDTVVTRITGHVFGVSILADRFGPLQQNQFALNYGIGVRLNEKLNLRFGSAFTFENNQLNPTKMVLDEANDPEYTGLLLNGDRANKMDINIGVALTGANYYIGYAAQDILGGKVINGNDVLKNMYARQHVIQGGYRRGLTDQFGLIANGIVRYDSNLKETFEAQLKGVVNNAFWAGIGYRNGLAVNFLAGARLNRVRIGYVREMAMAKAQGMNGGTNELMLSFDMFRVNYSKQTKDLSIW